MARKPAPRKIVIPYAPRDLQQEIHTSLKRWNVLVCHRRFGKSVLAVNQAIKTLFETTLERPRVAYIGPLLKQVKAIAWDYCKHYSEPIPGRSVNESELRIDFPGDRRLVCIGSDNPDALRGIYLDLAVVDEYGQCHPRLLPEILRPALADRKGSLICMGTPNGPNHFHDLWLQACEEQQTPGSDWYAAMYKASETKVIDDAELEDARRLMSESHYRQEFECDFAAAVMGAIYGREMERAEHDGRIRTVPYDPAYPVATFWDLGQSNATVVWFGQMVDGERRFFDYYANSGEPAAHYAQVLLSKGYTYSGHYWPWDAGKKEFGTGMNVKQIFEQRGLTPGYVVPMDARVTGIEAVRVMLGNSYFDKGRCAEGLKALRAYHYEYDDKRGTFGDKPYHDWASDPADALRTAAMSDWNTYRLPRLLRDTPPAQVVTDYDPFADAQMG